MFIYYFQLFYINTNLWWIQSLSQNISVLKAVHNLDMHSLNHSQVGQLICGHVSEQCDETRVTLGIQNSFTTSKVQD